MLKEGVHDRYLLGCACGWDNQPSSLLPYLVWFVPSLLSLAVTSGEIAGWPVCGWPVSTALCEISFVLFCSPRGPPGFPLVSVPRELSRDPETGHILI